MSRGADLLVCVWLTLCAAAFWGPYVGVFLPSNGANALYAVFLLSVIGIVLVRWLQSRTAAEKATQSMAAVEENGRDSGHGGD